MLLRLTLLILLILGVAAHQHGDPISLLRRTQHRGVRAVLASPQLTLPTEQPCVACTGADAVGRDAT